MRQRLAQVDLREHEEKILLLLALVVSAIVGLVVVAFVAVTERMGELLLSAPRSQRLLAPVAGSLVGGWLLYKFFPDARGSGIPQTRVALLLHNGYIGFRTVIGKFICSSLTLASGIALGREGPSVHIGAGIASVAGRKLGLGEEHVRSLIPVGTAAAVAAAFNTPLAAVLFTLEEILADLHARVVGSVVIGAATSWIVLRLILGDEPLFHVPAYQLVHPLEFLIYALLGVCGGLVSTVFVKLLLWLRAGFLKVPARWKSVTPGVGGLVVGLLALAVPGILGVGYNLVSEALNGELAVTMMLILLALKILATTVSYSSGNAGGIFGPSLFIGAMLGGAIGHAAHSLLPYQTGNAGAYALVGMGAAFAGIIRTPMTSVIMIFEVTRDYTIIVPLMISNLCSYVIAQRLHRMPIYESLSRQDGVTMPSAAHRPALLTVERAMREPPAGAALTVLAGVPHVYPDDPLDTAMQRLGEAGLDQIAVLSRAGRGQVGTLTFADAVAAYRDQATERASPAPGRNWLPVTAAVTVAAVLIVSGLVFWQRSRRLALGADAYEAGQKLLEQGRVDEAIAALRTGLAQSPRDAHLRAALGLALVQSGRFPEASSYLNEVAKAEPGNGPVWLGLAEIAAGTANPARALELYPQALAKEWPASDEPHRRSAELDYAVLLAEAGRRTEAVNLLQSVIARRGDDPVLAKRAAALIKQAGTPSQVADAYQTLAAHFPGDSGVWLSLGDARFATDQDAPALEAYRRALAADAQNSDARRAVTRMEDILKLDATRRGLSVRERARRWDELLGRTLTAAEACEPAPAVDKFKPLLKQRAASLEASDRKMEAALSVWKAMPASCKTDDALKHILAKSGE